MGTNDNHRSCIREGCAEAGQYPAPRRRQMPVSVNSPFAVADDVPLERDWYCLAHIREFNRGWDFFSGMQEPEIDAFRKDAVTGHRVTRKIAPHVVENAYRAAEHFRQGREAHAAAPSTVAAPTAEEREALAVFGLDYPATAESVKRRYRELVKKHHPDRNPEGDARRDEETIKAINHAYVCLQALTA